MGKDTFRIDSHKLMYHPERVGAWRTSIEDWEQAKKIYPIYMEISPIGACNHRCGFCALDYMGYKPRSLDVGLMQERLAEMGRLGVRSVMFAGEGEPLLHKGINDISKAAVDAGIDIAFTTNGVLMDDEFINKTLPVTSWVKVSFNAGTAETYGRIHGTDPGDFDKVVANLTRAVKARKENGWRATIGLQMLLLPENADEAVALARIARDEIGADYLVIKPYSQHKFSVTNKYESVDYTGFAELDDQLSGLNTDDFHVVYRSRTMKKYSEEKHYGRCHSTPFFWAYVSSGGGVYTCSAYLSDERFKLGSLAESGFREIWEGEGRKRNFEMLGNGFDISQCRQNCRMDDINIYLWQLMNPAAHVNFI